MNNGPTFGICPAVQRIVPEMTSIATGLAMLFSQALLATSGSAHEGLADLVEKARPAVVSVFSLGPKQPLQVPDGVNPLLQLEEFFGRELPLPKLDAPQQRRISDGSGFIISEDGFIVTNHHVVKDAETVYIDLFGGERLKAHIVGVDPKTDIALLKVETDKALPTVVFGDSEDIRVGDTVIAMGNPYGLDFSVSSGIVSARNRSLSGVYDDFIQTDAAINFGNSGGPLFNEDGEVVGVNTAIFSNSDPVGGTVSGSIGLGFSMSSAVVSKVVAQLQEYGETRRGWMGVFIQEVTEDIASALELKEVAGALVSNVPPGPSMDAGLQAGDVILTFDGKLVPNTREFINMVGESPVGKTISVGVFRDSRLREVQVTLGRREESEPMVQPASLAQEDTPRESDLLGLTLSEITPFHQNAFSLGEDVSGLIVLDVDQNSKAWEEGIRKGDVIESVGLSKVEAILDVERALSDARDRGKESVLLGIIRGGRLRFLGLEIAS